MASSSPASQRRKSPRKRQPLARSNSSLFGAIKNLVTAPLAWFTSPDEFEDSTDLKGKRRRLVSTELNIEHDDQSKRNKRMRMRSPPKELQQSQPPSGNVFGYLDPPVSAFQQQHRPTNPLNQPISTRSTSVSTPVQASRTYDLPPNNTSYNRANTQSRTMSIDPPAPQLSNPHAITSHNLKGDISMNAGNFNRPTGRDLSMPPLSGHSSFRIRTSMTPQPNPHRDRSEPPPISTLISNPTFIRAPRTHATNSLHSPFPTQQSITLGSLVDSARSTRSPARQHSSLLFGSSVEQASVSPHPESSVEKALHELDIYKTPLLPSRLRSSNTPAPPTSSDLFKSRRASHLVLMQDDKRTNRLGRTANKKGAPVANETKPYAGEGGMKKLLTRRKLEAEESYEEKVRFNNINGQELPHDHDHDMNDGRPEYERKNEKAPAIHDADIPSRASPLPTSDWFSATSDSSSTPGMMSSLRVGRSKARNHISRPAARPIKMKFSAAYDDDDAMDDAEGDDTRKKNDAEAIEEAAKRAPLFKIPEGFTFAKDTSSIKHDLANAKEPPITSLPFSFAQPPSAVEIPPVALQLQTMESSTVSSLMPPTVISTTSSTAPASATIPSTLAPEVAAIPLPNPVVTIATTPMADSSDRVPNFFSNSPTFTKVIDIPQQRPLFFPPADSAIQTPASNGSTLSAPVKDAENPLWEGENEKKLDTPIVISTPFGGEVEGISSVTPSISSGGSDPSVVTALPVPSISTLRNIKDDVPNQIGTLRSSAPSPQAMETTPQLFDLNTSKPPVSFNAPTNATPTPSFSMSASKPNGLFDLPKTSASIPFSFGRPVSSSSDPVKPTVPPPFSFGNSSSNIPKAVDHPSPSFDRPITSPATTSEVLKPVFSGYSTSEEAPRSIFGGAGRFNLGAEEGTEKRPTNAPFSFGATPRTPPIDNKRNDLFNFGATTPATQPAPASIGFSFSGGGAATAGVTKPFAFGQPVAITPTDRPSTPPRNQEVSMEESPTREIQQVNNPSDRLTLGGGDGGGFSFTSAAPGVAFGVPTNGSSTSFLFGTSSNSNPFPKASKPEESKSFGGGGFGETTTAVSAGFGFRPTHAPDKESSQLATTGPFAFGTSPSSITTSVPTFTFGALGTNSTSSVFGQPSSSAPSSPSTFTQSSPFTFGTPLPVGGNPFAFGSSQPASPAGANINLPQPATSGGFGQTQTSSSFGAPVTAPASGALFTIGAAPIPLPATGARQIRKLPTRRGGNKR